MQNLKLAVILAAGSGIRIQNHIEKIPKGFITIDGETLIERSLDALLENGIERIIIVTGYQAEYYEALKPKYPRIETVHNEKYAESGSMYSLYVARHEIQEDFLLLESDLLYEKRALQVLQSETREHAILISGTTNSGDEVYIDGDEEGRSLIRNISKNIDDIANPVGELVGISRISLELLDKMNQKAEEGFQETLKLEYESGAINKVADEYPVFFSKIEDLVWTEIDTREHLERAGQLIYPRIQANNKAYA